MINQEKVRLMTRMAIYEKSGLKEDERISTYYRSDYAGFNTLITGLLITLAYAIAAALVAVTFMEEIIQHLSVSLVVSIIAAAIVGYVALLAITCVASYRFYKNRHSDARIRMKQYHHDLAGVNRVYEEENE